MHVLDEIEDVTSKLFE